MKTSTSAKKAAKDNVIGRFLFYGRKFVMMAAQRPIVRPLNFHSSRNRIESLEKRVLALEIKLNLALNRLGEWRQILNEGIVK